METFIIVYCNNSNILKNPLMEKSNYLQDYIPNSFEIVSI